MVTRELTHSFLTDPEFRETREFLSSFGIADRPTDEYFEEDLLKAISTRPWQASLEQEIDPPGWKAVIREWKSVSQSRAAVAYDRDRTVALLRAIKIALTWPTPEQEKESFEDQTRALLGLSADEFMRRWQAHELSIDDPRVGHLLIIRPFGW
jgi:hypothetical protein